MGNNVVIFPTQETALFGICPKCGRADGFVNIGRVQVFFCNQHRTKWWAGANLFSGRCDENPEIWEENKRQLAAFRDVEPLWPADHQNSDNTNRNLSDAT